MHYVYRAAQNRFASRVEYWMPYWPEASVEAPSNLAIRTRLQHDQRVRDLANRMARSALNVRSLAEHQRQEV